MKILKLLTVNAKAGKILQFINLKVDEMLRELDAGNSGNVGLDDFLRCNLQGVFSLVLPLKVQSTNKLIKTRLGLSRPIYVNVDSPNLGFPYFNFLGGTSEEKNTQISVN